VFCQKGQNVPKISGTFCPFCQKNLGWTVRPEGIFCPRDVLSQGPFQPGTLRPRTFCPGTFRQGTKTAVAAGADAGLKGLYRNTAPVL
jgi:hypothetical protein